MKRWFKGLFGKGPPPDGPTDDILTTSEIEALLRGDKIVMGKLITVGLPIVRGAVRRVLSRRPQSSSTLEDDLTQDVIDKLLFDPKAALARFDATKGKHLSTYLRQWAQWRTLDFLRSPRYHHPWERLALDGKKLLEPDPVQPEESAPPDPDQLWTDLKQLFESRASDEQKELFHQIYVLQKKAKDLAEEMGISAMTLHQRLFRLRKLLLALRDELLCVDDPESARKNKGPGSRN